MERATDAVLEKRAEINQKSATNGADLRTAALLVAIQRVAQVALERGIWP
jgi:hypothetical protein